MFMEFVIFSSTFFSPHKQVLLKSWLKVEVMGSVFDDRTEGKRLKNFLKIVLGN